MLFCRNLAMHFWVKFGLPKPCLCKLFDKFLVWVGDTQTVRIVTNTLKKKTFPLQFSAILVCVRVFSASGTVVWGGQPSSHPQSTNSYI